MVRMKEESKDSRFKIMLTAEQIRAARAILKWGQGDLASASGVSVPTVANIETDRQKPNDSTLHKLQDALQSAGIEFIEGGVRRVQNLVKIYEGDDCYLRLLDDAFLALVKDRGEILFSAADDRRSPPAVIEKFRAMRRSGIRMRSLVRDKDTYLMGDVADYRWMDEKLFVDGDVKIIFGDVVAYLMTWLDVPRVVLVQDKHIADENRRMFEFVWDVSRKPTHSTAKERTGEGAK